jgi:2-polyprenyl-3-methyl-5-hydroxy-6-metoxy-1,4-benzoquinol methylase
MPMNTSIYQDGTYLEKNPTWHEEDSAWKAHKILKMLDRNKMHPKTIGEVGCGAGGMLGEIVRNLDGVTAVGYEISPQAFAMCGKKTNEKLSFRLTDILETDNAYEVVIAADVIEHIEDYIGFLRKLRTHGKFHIFHIPLDITVLTVARATPIRKLRSNVGHLHHFTKEAALGTLDIAGYRLLDWFYTYLMVDGPGRSRLLARMAYLPRKIALSLNEDLAVRFLGGGGLMVLCE